MEITKGIEIKEIKVKLEGINITFKILIFKYKNKEYRILR